MSTRVSDLAPSVAAAAFSFLQTLNDKQIKHAVTSTLRTVDEQIAYYVQGRASLEIVNLLRKKALLTPVVAAENTYTITRCDGINTVSNHQGGRALDVVPLDEEGHPVWPVGEDPRWQQIADVGKSFGFQWGGDWKDFPDRPHYEMFV